MWKVNGEKNFEVRSKEACDMAFLKSFSLDELIDYERFFLSVTSFKAYNDAVRMRPMN